MQHSVNRKITQRGASARLLPISSRSGWAVPLAQRRHLDILCHATVTVNFHMPYKTAMGDHLAVVGAGDLLGHWDVEKRKPLRWTEGDEWVGELECPPGSTLEYKYVVVRRDGRVEWSPGNNYMLEVVSSRGASMGVYEGWVNDGPRHVNITEPEPGRATSSSSPAPGEAGHSVEVETAEHLVSSMVTKLNSATERLMRVEFEAIIIGLLAQFPLMTAEKLHKAMQTVKPKRGELNLEQVSALLGSMIRQQKLVEVNGRYRLPDAAAATAEAVAEEAPTPRRSPETTARPAAAPLRESPGRRAVPPQPARYVSPPSPAAVSTPAPSARSARTDSAAEPSGNTPPTVLIPAIMKLLEVYSGMTLERLHRVLGGAVPNFTLTPEQLAAQLAELQASRRVLLQDGTYRKGLATPSPSRRANPPQPTRAPRAYQAAAPVTVAPPAAPAAPAAAAPAPVRPRTPVPARSAGGTPTPAPPSRSAAPVPARAQQQPAQQQVSADGFAAYEQRALSLLSNYSGCTVERLLGQLKSTTDFPGGTADLDGILRKLASEGRVKEDVGGIFRYVSTRSATPTLQRGGGTTSPVRSPSPVARAIPMPAPAPVSAPAPAAAQSYGAVNIDHLIPYEQRALSVLSNYSGSTAERLLGQLKATIQFPGTQQELDAMLKKLAAEGRVKDDGGIFRYVSTRSATPTLQRSASPIARAASPAAAPAPRATSPAPARNIRSPSPAPPFRNIVQPTTPVIQPPRAGVVDIEHLVPFEQRALSVLSNYSGSTAERLLGQLKATIQFPGNQQELEAMLKKLAAEGRVKEDVGGIFRYVSTRSATPTLQRGGGTASPVRSPSPTPRAGPAPASPGARIGSPVPGRPKISAWQPAGSRNGTPSASRNGSPGASRSPVAARASGSDSMSTKSRNSSLPASQNDAVDGVAPLQTAYGLFCGEYRDAMRARYPKAAPADLAQLLASEWQAVLPTTRARFERAAAADKARFEAESQQAANSSNQWA